jgi:hypothetical protein
MDTQQSASQEPTPAETPPQESTPKTESQLKRRGLIGAVAALAAGLLAKTTTQTAEAQGTPLNMGVNNTSTATTGLNASAGSTGIVVSGSTANGAFAILGQGTGAAFGVGATATGNTALTGTSSGGNGIVGVTTTPGFSAVLGNAAIPAGGPGAAVGVTGASATLFGVQGLNSGSGGGAAAGVLGQSLNGIGVQGQSQNSNGVAGASVASVGVFGQTATASQYAAQFVNATGATGNGVIVQGSLSVSGIKSAIVPAPDGSLQRMYCMESTEAWFEDFGEARLSGGSASVAIPRDFAGVVDLSRYQVYVQATDAGCLGLAVTARRPDHFEVTELQGGGSNAGFSFRLVAKRKDVASPRLQRVPQPPNPPAFPELRPNVRLPGSEPTTPSTGR